MPSFRNTKENIMPNVRCNIRPDEEDWPSNNPMTGSLFLEDGSSYFLLETGDKLLLE